MANNYNFALFEAGAEQKGAAVPAKKNAQLKVVKKKREEVQKEMRVTGRRAVALIVLCAMLFAPIFYFIYAEIQLEGVSRSIASDRSAIADERSENIRLTAELNALMTLDKIEDYAENVLGMVKLGAYNIEYYDFSGEDRVVLSGGKTYGNTGDGSFISRLLSYLL